MKSSVFPVNDNLKIYHYQENSNRVIASLAIGEKYLADFESFCVPFLLRYCKANFLSLVCIVDYIETNNTYNQKPTWQKYLIPTYLSSCLGADLQICYIDSDILANPYGENIFDKVPLEYFGFTSLFSNLPFDRSFATRQASLLRKNYYDPSYPLNSLYNASPEEIYSLVHSSNLPSDLLCAGLFVCSTKHHADILSNFYYNTPNIVDSPTNGGDQTHFSYFFAFRRIRI